MRHQTEVRSTISMLQGQAIQLINQYIAQLHKRNIYSISGSHCNFDKIYKQLDKDSLKRIILHLRPAISTLNNIDQDESISAGDKTDELFFLQRFLFLQKLKMAYKVTDIIDQNDVIEIYDRSAIQMYRSFNFFNICSYSFEELFTNEWWNLFERSVFVTNRLTKIFTDIFRDNDKEIKFIKVPDHWVNEIASKHKMGCYVRQGIACPLYDESGTVSAVLATFSIIKTRDQSGNIIGLAH